MKRISFSMLILGLFVLFVGLWIIPGNVLSGESEKEERGFLGVSVKDVDKKFRKKFDLERKEGVQITHVTEDSPADFADLEYNDIILEVNGSKLKSPTHLTRLIRKQKPGDKIALLVIHDGKEKKMNVELAEYDDDKDHNVLSFFSTGDHAFAYAFGKRPYLGVYLQQLNEDLAEYFKVDEEDGVLITEVEEESPAEDAGIKPGDILTEIDNERVESPEDAMDILRDFEAGDEVEIGVLRSGSKKKFSVELDEPSSTIRSGNIFFKPGRKNLNITIPKVNDARFLREIIELEIGDNINDQIRGIIEHKIRNQSENRIIIQERAKDNNRKLYRLDEQDDRIRNKPVKIKEGILKVVSTKTEARSSQVNPV